MEKKRINISPINDKYALNMVVFEIVDGEEVIIRKERGVYDTLDDIIEIIKD
jgi:hypothetical protein